MDPNVTLREFRAAMANGELESAAYIAEMLDDWLSKKGFLPDAWSNGLERYGKQYTGSDRIPRMTNAQRDRLWVMCGNYGVAFNETDYVITPEDASMTKGFATGMIGGWGAGTIEVGVEPNGRSHS